MRVFGVTGVSGSGKTTLMEQLLPIFRQRGTRVVVVKHTHHAVDLDQPGKDSFRFRQAGAEAVMLASRDRWALLRETPGNADLPDLRALLAPIQSLPADLVLAEGFKSAALDKLEVHRPAVGKPPLWPDDPRIVAVASPEPMAVDRPWLPLNEPEIIARFIAQRAVAIQTWVDTG